MLLAKRACNPRLLHIVALAGSAVYEMLRLPIFFTSMSSRDKLGLSPTESVEFGPRLVMETLLK